MRCEKYVVVGLAKTGTTVVARTLQRTLQIRGFCMEPKNPAEIGRAAASCERLVVKIIFDHWQDRLDDLAQVCAGDGTSSVPTVIFVIRDPRDEIVSRLHYFPYTVFTSRPSTPEQRVSCIALFERKEASPETIGLLDLQEDLWRMFGRRFFHPGLLHRHYAEFVQGFVDASRDKTYLLRYEEFISRAIPEPPLQAMLTGAQEVPRQEQRVLRSASSGAWNRFFTDPDTAFFNQYFEMFLVKFGYPLERRIGAGPPVSSTTGSEYVARLIKEACTTFETNTHIKSAAP
jgi:hypothetical protein